MLSPTRRRKHCFFVLISPIDHRNIDSVTDLYAKRISAIDHDYYQNYINRKKFEQLERQRKIIEDEIDWRTNEKCRLENELKNAGIFCNKALIKDRIAFLKAKIDALCKQVSELK